MATFDVKNPGVKEFAIVGGGTLAVILVWSWWSKRQGKGQAAAQPATGQPVPQAYEGTTPTGLSLGSLLLWLQDHASSSTTTTRTTTTTPPRPKPPQPPPRPPRRRRPPPRPPRRG